MSGSDAAREFDKSHRIRTSVGRRQLLAAVSGLAGLAGCSALSDDDGSDGGSDDGHGPVVADAGEEAETQTVDTVAVGETRGRVASGGASIGRVQMAVQLAQGSEQVDLSAMTIQYVAHDASVTLAHQSTSTDGEPAFGTRAVSAEDEHDAVLESASDEYEIVVPLGDAAGEYPALRRLEPGTAAQLTLAPDTDAQRVVRVEVPSSLGDVEAGETVAL
ncbi:flagellin-like protein [Salinarchaeum sp. Harcht-Bsk1]|uniref:hypothetical protein n=1 Tax=Salinarchaeum sp. Harcht-Bsk1 TaxID=1333523 RepID=UPI000342313F|nr:hypothetical protein [Salinarchaeum sp. Harcht-Bsk1]AGN00654.1 flagellin-like protein [Salinarchaeum sp. Harcht-Bsk1]